MTTPTGTPGPPTVPGATAGPVAEPAEKPSGKAGPPSVDCTADPDGGLTFDLPAERVRPELPAAGATPSATLVLLRRGAARRPARPTHLLRVAVPNRRRPTR